MRENSNKPIHLEIFCGKLNVKQCGLWVSDASRMIPHTVDCGIQPSETSYSEDCLIHYMYLPGIFSEYDASETISKKLSFTKEMKYGLVVRTTSADIFKRKRKVLHTVYVLFRFCDSIPKEKYYIGM